MKQNTPSRSRTLALLLLVGLSVSALAQMLPLRYDVEYEAIGYSANKTTDRLAQLVEEIEEGRAALEFSGENGYLSSLLNALGIDTDSQILVFSKTSVQTSRITPENPRAIYFDDDVYVAWTPGSGALELAAMDPNLGPVFYTLAQTEAANSRIDRETAVCLRCHDSYSMTGGGVPRFILGSGYTNTRGLLVSHEAWIITTDRTPLRSRWGGWYVTGTHGEQGHLGNLVVRDPGELQNLDLLATGNVTELSTLIDPGLYLGGHSDIAALMVIEHQVALQNTITRVNFDARQALHEERAGNLEAGLDQAVVSEETIRRIQGVAEPLVRALLFVGEATIEYPLRGTSGFAERFSDEGPKDSTGRSLRELDLTTRVFRYPCSYLIYSEAFDALPELVKDYVYGRLNEVLDTNGPRGDFSHLSDEDATAILKILRDTKSDFAAFSGD